MKDLIVKYDDELIYRGKDLFGFKIKEDVDETWNAYEKHVIENYIKADHFFDEYDSVEAFLGSKDVDKSKITFELVDHDREECQKFFERDFE